MFVPGQLQSRDVTAARLEAVLEVWTYSGAEPSPVWLGSTRWSKTGDGKIFESQIESPNTRFNLILIQTLNLKI